MEYPRILEEPADEESGDAFSPEQPASQESQGSAASPGEIWAIEESSPFPNNFLQVFLPPPFHFRAHGAKKLIHNVLCFTALSCSDHHFNRFPQAFFHQWAIS